MALVAAVAAPRAGAAQPPSAGVVVERDSSARLERVAAGVYAIIHDRANENWPHGNSGVIVGDSAVLVVDATYYPSRARADIALIRRLTQLPIRYLVNTHWHGDHTHGNAVYRDLNPGIRIVSARASLRFIDLNLERLPRRFLAADSPQRAALARIEATLAAGRDSAGQVLSAESRSRLQESARLRRVELAELALVRVVVPDLLFDERLDVDLGGRRVVLVNQGRANSPADVTVYAPAERVLFTGDILVFPTPYAYGAMPLDWIGALRALEALPVAAVVPGHGPVLPDHTYTRLVRETIETLAQRTDALHRQGLGEPELIRAIEFGDLQQRFLAYTGGGLQSFASFIRDGLMVSLYACVWGYRC